MTSNHPELLDASESGSSSGRRLGFAKKLAKEVGKAGKSAAYKARRFRSAKLTFGTDGGEGGSHSRTFAITRKLGEGGYSTIWSVRERQPDGAEMEYAVKRVLIDGSDSEQNALVEGEIAAMRSLPPHPNVVALLGFCRRPRSASGGGGGGGRSLDEVYMLLEMCSGGSLAGMLQQRAQHGGAPLRPAESLRIFLDMTHAVAHMHGLETPLAHRDVKPENYVLSEEDGMWKLCDFGSATARTFRYDASAGGVLGAGAGVADEEERIHRYSTPQYLVMVEVACLGGAAAGRHSSSRCMGRRRAVLRTSEEQRPSGSGLPESPWPVRQRPPKSTCAPRLPPPCGRYRAPEMCDVRRGELVGPKCDVWALGVSLFKMTRLRDLFGVAGEERLAILNFEPHAKLPRPADAAVCCLGARSLDTQSR